MASSKKRIRRSSKSIARLLKDQSEKGYTAREFCARHGISKQTYYNWHQRNRSETSSVNSFIPFEVAADHASESMPFCEIIISQSTSIRFYKPIDGKFIRSLNLY